MPELDFTGEEIEHLLSNLEDYTSDELAEIDVLVDELAVRDHNQKAHDDLIEFCKQNSIRSSWAFWL